MIKVLQKMGSIFIYLFSNIFKDVRNIFMGTHYLIIHGQIQITTISKIRIKISMKSAAEKNNWIHKPAKCLVKIQIQFLLSLSVRAARRKMSFLIAQTLIIF